MATKELNVYQKLAIVQSELKAPKSCYNSFGKYNYRNCEDILSAARPLCNSNGLTLTLNDEVVMINEGTLANVTDFNKKNNQPYQTAKILNHRVYVKATATVTDVLTGEQVSTTAYARESAEKTGMDDSQLTGATSSYARKYALGGLFAIDDTKDADTNEYKQATTDNLSMLRIVSNTMKEKGLSADDIKAISKAKFGNDNIRTLSNAQLSTLNANMDKFAIEVLQKEDEK